MKAIGIDTTEEFNTAVLIDRGPDGMCTVTHLDVSDMRGWPDVEFLYVSEDFKLSTICAPVRTGMRPS